MRDGVGMVLQKNVLFSGSIEENLRWGDENATMEEIRAAADAAQADGFVNAFTDGYNMELGQGGVNVSGGQKQRLCIARALLKKPKILILDDSTSAVDTATEAKIRQAFTTSLKHSTKIIIAQRITSVIDADKIIVLEDGKIIGMGNHNELMKNCEEYRDIYYSQTDKEKKFLNLYILSAHDKKCIDYVGRKAMEVKCLQWDHRTETEIRKNRNLKIQRRLQKDCFRIWNRKSIKLRRHLYVFW